MIEKTHLRRIVKDRLDDIIDTVNQMLKGQGVISLKPILERIGRGGKLPHWYEQLYTEGTLPNLDGKTIGSILEMLFVGILETKTFTDLQIPKLRINPARGVDLPDLDLSIKSPSENFCTSEPFFSAYERLLGSEYDAVIMLTDYQDAKSKPPLKLQVIQWRYLLNTEIADSGLCNFARKHRDWLLSENELWAKRFFRFLAHVNQSDWKVRQLLKLINVLDNEGQIGEVLKNIGREFIKANKDRTRKGKELLSEDDHAFIEAIAKIKPLHVGILDALDNWIVEAQGDFARLPNENEWGRFLRSPLNGKIGISFALQWRFNFGRVFQNESTFVDEICS